MRVLIVQYAGDYREAVYRFADHQAETYHAQKYSVDAVAAIGQAVEEIAVLCCLTDTPYNERLPNGVRGIGAGPNKVNFKAIVQLIAAYQPTHLVLSVPSREILSWAIQAKMPTLAVFADSFVAGSLRARMRHYLLSRALNHPQIEWVANHGITAAQSLQTIGVDSNKIIPWDWIHSVTPHQFPAKLGAQGRTLVYVGAMTASKGVGDALEAVALLRAQNFPVQLKLVGPGDIDRFQQQARELEITESVEFLGLVENQQVVPLMRLADLVLVPSRHEYPEGFPLTIYEALSARTPMVASDHPMFVQQLQQRSSAMLFPAGNAAALADAIETILTDAALYRAISASTQATWERLQIPVKWAELLNRWIFQSPQNRQWLAQHSLASGQYQRRAEPVRQAAFAG